MTKFDQFFTADEPEENLDDMQRLDGLYGCQLCEKDTSVAYFNEKVMEMFWYCPDKHRSSQQFGG